MSIEEPWSTVLSAIHAASVGIAAPASMVGVSAGGDEPELTADAGRSTACVWDSPLDHGPSTDWKCLWDVVHSCSCTDEVFEWTPPACMVELNRYTGMDKTCSVCGAQTLIVDESSDITEHVHPYIELSVSIQLFKGDQDSVVHQHKSKDESLSDRALKLVTVELGL